MTEWTTSARKELDRYFSQVRYELEGSGADATEVLDDLRRHIDEEVAAAKLHAVTEDGVRRILSRIGPVALAERSAGTEEVETAGNGGNGKHGVTAARQSTSQWPVLARQGAGDVPTAPDPPDEAIDTEEFANTNPVRSTEASGRKRPVAPPGVGFVIFGVILPSLTIGVELVTRMCTAVFFDPLPTFWHLLLSVLVPISNGMLAWAMACGRRDCLDVGMERLAGSSWLEKRSTMRSKQLRMNST